MSDIDEAKRLILAQYEQEYEDLGRVIARLRRDLGRTPNETAVAAAAAENGGAKSKLADVNLTQLVKPGDLFGMTQAEAAKKVLQLTGRRPLSLQDIAGALYRGKATE